MGQVASEMAPPTTSNSNDRLTVATPTRSSWRPDTATAPKTAAKQVPWRKLASADRGVGPVPARAHRADLEARHRRATLGEWMTTAPGAAADVEDHGALARSAPWSALGVGWCPSTGQPAAVRALNPRDGGAQVGNSAR